MTNEILELLNGTDWITGGSVSSGDALGMETVSSGDAAGSIFYQVNLYAAPEDDVLQETQQEDYTLWDKPLEDYTVTEGLLLVLVLLAVVVLVWQMIKGGFKWQK